MRLPLAGDYNVSNALVAAGCALSLGMGLDAIVAGLESAPQVPGRLERVDCGQAFAVLVDYAHTPDSLEKAIAAVREVTRGRVITVFGCGGDRDPEKRPLMGRAAAGRRPRRRDQRQPALRGPGRHHPADRGRVAGGRRLLRGRSRPPPRDRAGALASASRGDAVLIAGKGHEDYQIFADRTIHFDDREVAREVLGRMLRATVETLAEVTGGRYLLGSPDRRERPRDRLA